MWDVTCSDTLAHSYVSLAVREPGAVAADAEYRKTLKYGHLSSTHCFVPIRVETLGVFGKEARCSFKEVAHRIEKESDDHIAFQHLIQRISVVIQIGNTVSILGCLG